MNNANGNGSSAVTTSYGFIVVEGETRENKNVNPDERLQELLFNALVNSGRSWPSYATYGASVSYLRPGPLRYTKPNTLAIGGAPNIAIARKFNSAFASTQVPIGISASAPITQVRSARRDYTTGVIASNALGFSFGGLSAFMTDTTPNGVTGSSDGAAGLPSTYLPLAALSWVDVPGTSISTLYKHPVGRTGWFNEVGQVALSQGEIEIDGPYSPSESNLQHMGYQVYYAKSGGTGRPGNPANAELTSPIGGSQGTTSSGAPSTFVDGQSQGLFIPAHASGNYYIRVNSLEGRGTYKITTFVDANTVTTDAELINQPLPDSTELAWEVVTGPVGEYFWRKRSYAVSDNWDNAITVANTNYNPLTGLQNEVMGLQNTEGAVSTRIFHDRGACWWALANNGSVPLMRWVHNSPQSFEPMHTTGKISGLSSWPFLAGNVRDMAIDDQNKIWVVGDPVDGLGNRDGRVSVLRIDPYPAGNSETPAFLSSFSGDMSAAATPSNPLGSNEVEGIVCDDSQAYAPNTRVWLLPGPANALNGISYTDDYGATWSRLHVLDASDRTGTVSTSGSTVTGAGTSFDTDFAVGDWVRFTGVSRSFRITAITDALSMTIDTTYGNPGALAGVTYRRGALDNLTIACISLLTGTSVSYSAFTACAPPCDYDSDGNLYWISSDRNSVVRWSESAGVATTLSRTTISTPSPAPTFDAGTLSSLTVQRIPTPAGASTHPLHNAIWVGSFTQGMSLIFPVFDGSHVRYNKAFSANSWPTSMIMTSPSTEPYMPRAVVNKQTGHAFIFARNGGTGSVFNLNPHYSINHSPQGIGQFTNLGIASSSATNNPSQGGAFTACEYDEVGLGMRGVIVPTYLDDFSDNSNFCGSIQGGPWLCGRWDGSAWPLGLLNSLNANVDFAAALAPAGPYVDFPVSVGSGLKRVHPDWEVLDANTGLRVRFVDSSPQTVAQSQQFIVDENSTFVCWVGQGKTNTQTAFWGVDYYTNPTIIRLQEEPTKLGRNIWTQDGGLDGGYVFGDATVGVLPAFSRGISVPSEFTPCGGAPLPALQDTRNNAGSGNQQFSTALRIKPELELAADGSVFGASGATPDDRKTFQSTAHTFVTGDIGKSIIIEGANGAAADNDNGQAVIVSIDPLDATRVVTDKTFEHDYSGLRWKLMDIPAVSYVAMSWDYAFVDDVMGSMDLYLYSSQNRGVSWSEVRRSQPLNDKPPGSDIISYQSPGITYNVFNYSLKSQSNSSSTNENISSLELRSDQYTSVAVIFDLRSLPESQRRRQYWKVRRAGPSNSSFSRPVGIHLLDENMQIMGVPANCLLSDVSDPNFRNAVIDEASIVAFDGGSATVSAFNIGLGYTNTLTLSAGSFFDTSGVDGVVSASDFSSATAAFLPEHVGRYIKISGSATPANNGFAVITAYVNGTTVTTDKSFTADSGLTWDFSRVGPGDFLRAYDPTFTDPALPSVNLSDSTFQIQDVESNALTLSSVSMPVAVTNKTFVIERSAGGGDDTLGNRINNADNPSPAYDASKRWSYSARYGALAWSREHEFVTLQSGSNATTNADDDADDRADVLNLTVNVSSDVAVGDYIEVVGPASYGRRVFEIQAIANDTPAPGQALVTVTYDELPVSTTFPAWTILRRRDQTFSYPRLLVVTKS
jgi:hypothetical protein